MGWAGLDRDWTGIYGFMGWAGLDRDCLCIRNEALDALGATDSMYRYSLRK